MKPANEKVPYDKSLRPVRTPGQLGDWATVAVLLLAACLWFLWPVVPPQRHKNWQIPEPVCAYGTLSPSSSAGDVLGRFTSPVGNSRDPGLFARLPSVEVPPIPEPAAPHFSSLPPPAYSDRRFPQSSFLVPPPPFPYRTFPTAPTGLVINVSSSLGAAGFAFAPPKTDNGTPFALRAFLSFGPQGDVESLLIDAFSGPDSLLLPWRTSLQLARSVTNAMGTVEITRAVASPPAFSLQ